MRANERVVPEQLSGKKFEMERSYASMLDQLRELIPELGPEGDAVWLEFLDTYEHWGNAYDTMLGVALEENLPLFFRARALTIGFFNYFILTGANREDPSPIEVPEWLYGTHAMTDIAKFFRVDSMTLSHGAFNCLQDDSQDFVITMIESLVIICGSVCDTSLPGRLRKTIDTFVIDSQSCDEIAFPEGFLDRLERTYPVYVTPSSIDTANMFDAIFCSRWMTRRGVDSCGTRLILSMEIAMKMYPQETYRVIVKKYFSQCNHAGKKMQENNVDPHAWSHIHLQLFLNIEDERLKREIFDMYASELCTCEFLYMQFISREFAEIRAALIHYMIASRFEVLSESLLKSLYKEFGNRHDRFFEQWHLKQTEIMAEHKARELLKKHRLEAQQSELRQRARKSEKAIEAVLGKVRESSRRK